MLQTSILIGQNASKNSLNLGFYVLLTATVMMGQVTSISQTEGHELGLN